MKKLQFQPHKQPVWRSCANGSSSRGTSGQAHNFYKPPFWDFSTRFAFLTKTNDCSGDKRRGVDEHSWFRWWRFTMPHPQCRISQCQSVLDRVYYELIFIRDPLVILLIAFHNAAFHNTNPCLTIDIIERSEDNSATFNTSFTAILLH